MRRREFIILVGGAAVAWPPMTRAQQTERVRRIGILLPGGADDPVFQARVAAFYQELALLGWSIGRNVRIEVRWATANAAEIRRHAEELAALAPDVILATGDSTIPPLLQATRTVPIVFPLAGDPVGAGFVDSLARPGGNATGFMIYEYGMGGLIVTASPLAQRHRDLIVTLAARHKLPAIYWERFFVTSGGLISYGPDLIDNYRRAAGYVNRILKGEKPADLPVQAPTKYQMVINLKTAKALGLSVPLILQQRADEVIE